MDLHASIAHTWHVLAPHSNESA